MTAPTPRGAEAVAHEMMRWLRDTWAYDALTRSAFYEEAVAQIAAALDAHATAAVAATETDRAYWHHRFVELRRTVQAAGDRLAAFTEDEVAQAIADAYPYAADRWDRLGETMRDEWRRAATAVLLLVRARVAGP